MGATATSRMPEAWKEFEGQLVDGEFQLSRYLGGSARSGVFLTEQGERERRRFAVKLVAADPGKARLQLSRWDKASRLSHPHLLRIFKIGRCRLRNLDLLYAVMEYAQEELSQVLPHRPLTVTEAREMLQPTVDALAYLHSQGLVHGHIKPANILAVDNCLKLSSDGLSAPGDLRDDLDKPSVYDPPEAVRGTISPAADMWALGLTLVEALTQRLPVWDQPQYERATLLDKLPAPFAEIARHCLVREPQRRWTIADVTGVLHPASSGSRKPSPGSPQASPRSGRLLIPIGLAALVLLAVLAPKLLRRQTADEPSPAPSAVSEPAQPTRAPVVSTPAPQQPVAVSKPATRVPDKGVVHEVVPAVPQSARNTIEGRVKVNVRVTVAPSGSVTAATFDSPGPSQYFARLAMEAARGWKFVPAATDGGGGSRQWTLRFEFGRTGTRVTPTAH